MDLKVKTEFVAASPQTGIDAYVYIHRSTRMTNGVAKVGSHTGPLNRLWKRYLTYNGTSQEFKMIQVSEEEARAFEKSIQLLLKRRGYWLDNEIFTCGAWMAFDAVASQFALPKQCVLHLRQSANILQTNHNILDDDDLLEVVELPCMTVEVKGADEKRQKVDEQSQGSHASPPALPFSVFVERALTYLEERELVRDAANGDIYRINGPDFIRIQSMREFVESLYNDPDQLQTNLIPKMTYFHTAMHQLAKIPSHKASFVNVPKEDGVEEDAQKVAEEVAKEAAREVAKDVAINRTKEQNEEMSKLRHDFFQTCVRFDKDYAQGTAFTDVQERYIRYCNDIGILRPPKFLLDDCSKVNKNWQKFRYNYCKECSIGHNGDFEKLRPHGASCRAQEHQRTTASFRIRYLRLI